MTGLLRANFARLWKTKALWGCIILPVLFHLLMLFLDGRNTEIFNSMEGTVTVSLFFSAVFAAMYIGTDNSDRTVRNKLIPGIPRYKVYFANLITVSAGMAVIFAANWLAVVIFDLANGGYLNRSAGVLVLYIAFCLLVGAAMMAVCTLLATLVTSKSVATVLTIVMTIGMFVGTNILPQLSTSPSHSTVSKYDPEVGEYVLVEEYDDYTFVVPKGVEKAADVLNELLPTSQMSNLWSVVAFWDNGPEFRHIEQILKPVWFSLGVSAAATVVGLLAFRKKDLK